MTRDALDPGPNDDYPAWPRRPDGSLDPERMPTGVHSQKVPTTSRRVEVDQTPRYPVDHPRAGEPIEPPDLP